MPSIQIQTPALTKRERYLTAARGGTVDYPPAWIMRQAGRYDPAYLELRERYSFRDLCTIPEVCARASILPLHTLDVDALIIFNDILTPLEDLGLVVEFPDSGPVIRNAPRDPDRLESITPAHFENPSVAANIAALREAAGPDVAVLGFAGSPFTMASYAIEGKMTRSQHYVKSAMFRHPGAFRRFLDTLSETVADYLVSQVRDGGAHAVQLFESQAGMLSPDQYAEWALPAQCDTIRRFKSVCPDVPVTLYARGSCSVVERMAESGADVISIDWTHTLAETRKRIPGKALQGNLDPACLLVPDAVEPGVWAMLKDFDWRRGFIANLGHGIIPQASVPAARAFIDCIHALAREDR